MKYDIMGNESLLARQWIYSSTLIELEVKMNFTIEQEQESDGRWLAEVPELPGVLAYGATSLEAMSKAEIIALRVQAERLEW